MTATRNTSTRGRTPRSVAHRPLQVISGGKRGPRRLIVPMADLEELGMEGLEAARHLAALGPNCTAWARMVELAARAGQLNEVVRYCTAHRKEGEAAHAHGKAAFAEIARMAGLRKAVA